MARVKIFQDSQSFGKDAERVWQIGDPYVVQLWAGVDRVIHDHKTVRQSVDPQTGGPLTEKKYTFKNSRNKYSCAKHVADQSSKKRNNMSQKHNVLITRMPAKMFVPNRLLA